MTSKGLFQPKAFYDSMNYHFLGSKWSLLGNFVYLSVVRLVEGFKLC